ncbi:MAG: MFS transporter [Clostridiales bacterium]|nr:MFS transporter [Clostridiales bacterium]
MKKNPQGRKWHRLDNTGKLFPMIANENLSNVFRVSAVLKEEVVPELLQRALEEVLPFFKGFSVRLKRGFFWYYFEENKRQPFIEEEQGAPCRYIDPKSNQMYLFRVTYFRRRINLEVFHAVTDGMGAMEFLKALVTRYLDLQAGREGTVKPCDTGGRRVAEDSYLKNYKKLPKRRYSSRPAYRIRGRLIPGGGQSIIQGELDLGQLKEVCKRRSVSVTRYLAACLIWSIYEGYMAGLPAAEPIAINLPINLRAFFGSSTTSNFFAVISLDYKPEKEHESFEAILESVCSQMDEKIVKEKLEEIISYNVSNEKKWYVRILPLFIKWMALGIIFRRNDRAHTITLSNIGPVFLEEEYQSCVENFHMMIGVSRRQPVKCGVCTFQDKVTCSFTSVYDDSRLADTFFGRLRTEGIQVHTKGNGMTAGETEQGDYPQEPYGKARWNPFFRHRNPGKLILLGTVLIEAFLVLMDVLLGYQAWSVNYGIPGAVLFADLALVFLILADRMNWQSYFMYQIGITAFSFLLLLLRAVRLITKPWVAPATVALAVLILGGTIFIGDRRFKSELKRRFHI